jgi:hypothetical protein
MATKDVLIVTGRGPRASTCGQFSQRKYTAPCVMLLPANLCHGADERATQPGPPKHWSRRRIPKCIWMATWSQLRNSVEAGEQTQLCHFLARGVGGIELHRRNMSIDQALATHSMQVTETTRWHCPPRGAHDMLHLPTIVPGLLKQLHLLAQLHHVASRLHKIYCPHSSGPAASHFMK